MSENEIPTRICKGCGKEFPLIHASKQYCKKGCGRKSSDVNKTRTERRAFALSILRECPCCDELFQAKTAKQKYCSEYCARRHWKILHGLIIPPKATETEE